MIEMDISQLTHAMGVVETMTERTYSGLEVILIAGVSALISAIGTILIMLNWFQTRDRCTQNQEKCGLRHIADGDKLEHMAKAIEGIRTKNNIQFRMIRALVSHMPELSPEVREKILNEGDGK